jgi:hypothetical protein
MTNSKHVEIVSVGSPDPTDISRQVSLLVSPRCEPERFTPRLTQWPGGLTGTENYFGEFEFLRLLRRLAPIHRGWTSRNDSIDDAILHLMRNPVFCCFLSFWISRIEYETGPARILCLETGVYLCESRGRNDKDNTYWSAK